MTQYAQHRQGSHHHELSSPASKPAASDFPSLPSSGPLASAVVAEVKLKVAAVISTLFLLTLGMIN